MERLSGSFSNFLDVKDVHAVAAAGGVQDLGLHVPCIDRTAGICPVIRIEADLYPLRSNRSQIRARPGLDQT